ncbi:MULTISPECIES: ABC transporter permease [Gemmobacter]|uniref:ABC-type spermidine/putrescine transport system permease subunit I n=2 Tax=Gemmobacter TaxID=204456 RepID=A0A2T6BAW4_9RHOB|nr:MULTISPECIES: ABC transporter permease [Gemmobacter]PTX53162.1 ABC-type spermidine/putrescine transport system permease subunit I [Gemmobacter caeni]TWJ05273.1 spermidine/putrescine transport system permease protein [Gemmobacter caeni]GHC17044.1 spermidine/putrescine ABC transporter permease [Gemmobacter nanjingensis]
MEQGAARGRFRNSEAANGLALVSPTAIYAILLLAAPLAAVVLYSLMVDSKVGLSSGLTFDNYLKVWTGRIDQALMIRSLTVSSVVTLVTVLLAYPVAYFVSFHVKPERKSMWIFLITIPFWTSYLIRVFLWKVILGYNGVINSGLMSLGIIGEPLTIINYSLGSMIMTLAHAYAAFAILPIFVSLEKIDRSLLEAGQDLGESKLMTFIRVTLPLSMPGVIAAVLIVFIPTIGDYVTPELIGGGKLPMIANRIEAIMLKQNDKALGSAIAVTAMLIVTVVSVVFLLLNRRFLRGQSK